MGRTILAVVLGYVVMAVVVMGGLTGAYLGMGADGAFEAGAYQVTTMWIVVMSAVGLVAAMIGGFVCAKIGKSKGAVLGLLGLIVVLGAVQVVFVAMAEEPLPEDKIRTADVDSMEAMMRAEKSVGLAALDPIIGVIGVFIGAPLGCGCRKDPEPAE